MRLRFLQVGRNLKPLDVLRRARFEKDRLPDSARGAVPGPLLPDRLLGVIHRVFHPHHEHPARLTGLIRRERFSEIELDRIVAAFVMAKMPAITPNIGEEIGRADCQDDESVLPSVILRNGDPAAIPTNFKALRATIVLGRDFERVSVNATRIVVVVSCRIGFAPGGERFPAKRDHNLFRPAFAGRLKPAPFLAHTISVEAKFPSTVQVQPIDSLHAPALPAGPWVLRAG